jgi:nucleotide-binding universal stress UspA family protein
MMEFIIISTNVSFQTIIYLYILDMKTIVLATDFSASADNAMLYAGNLANNIGAPLLLLHIYQVPVGMNDMPLLVVSTDELKSNADAGLSKAKELLLSKFSSLDVQTESRLGDVVDELKDICKKLDPLLIVVGKHGASGVQQILFGSTSFSIIRNISHPVIVVPGNTRKFQMENAALAIDADLENVCIQKIKFLVSQLKTSLHLVHVKPEKTAYLQAATVVSEFNSKCSNIYDHEFVHGIESYIKENNIDLLIILPHKHNLVERLFLKTHTKELLRKISIPIMCIYQNGTRHS